MMNIRLDLDEQSHEASQMDEIVTRAGSEDVVVNSIESNDVHSNDACVSDDNEEDKTSSDQHMQTTSNGDEDDEAWYLTNSNKQAQGGFKLYSNGFCYTVDKPNIKDIREGNYRCIYWRCELVGCRGRAITTSLCPPLEMSVAHNIHSADPSKLSWLKIRDQGRRSTCPLENMTSNSNNVSQRSRSKRHRPNGIFS